MKYYQYICFHILIIIFSQQINHSNSKITFENNVYQNILVAIDSDVDPTLCTDLIEQIMNIFNAATSDLNQITNSRANFGSIKILIPYQWSQIGSPYCNIANYTHSNYDRYENADFKITSSHPFAKNTPWTKQYKDCGIESESVFIPVEFLQTSNFDTPTKGRHLLHEWMKFRYGVFEEVGYYDDQIYTPCYTKNKTLFYSSCNGLDPIQDNIGNEDITSAQCRQQIEYKLDSLKQQLSFTSPSIMYNPHLNNGYHLCTNATHNGMSPTKQNIFCQRKSISEVMNLHSDFRNQLFERSKNPLFPPVRNPRSVSVQYVTQEQPLSRGFFFMTEDTAIMRQFGQLRHVKQGISIFANLATNGTAAVVYRYNGVNIPVTYSTNFVDSGRVRFLGYVPDVGTPPLGQSTIATPNSAGSQKIRSLYSIFNDALDYVGADQSFKVKWELILFTSSPPVAINEAISAINAKDFPVSIFTFDGSEEWLKFNTISNTRKVIQLPYCYRQADAICDGRTSSLIADHLLELTTKLKLQEDSQRFFQKVVDVTVNGFIPTIFRMKSVQNGQNFQLTVPVYDNSTFVSVSRIGGTEFCQTSQTSLLLSYEGVQLLNCPYVVGEWNVSIFGNQAVSRRTHIVQGYMITENSVNDLDIETSFGVKLENAILPRTNYRVPVYISITNKRDEPIVFAEVQLNTFYQAANEFQYLTQAELFDDGEDPDITKNDGIYSGFITQFSPDPSFQTGIITVTTSDVSKAVTGFQSEAALLDSTINSKCCGSSVIFSDSQTSSVGFSSYAITLPSFRTGESVDSNENLIPPSRIYSKIKIIAETEEYITLQFLAPGADHKENLISHYDICCTSSESGNLDDERCTIIAPENCNPVRYNEAQDCAVSLLAMYDAFFSGEPPDNETVRVTLYCGLRGVDADNNYGPLSSYLVEIILDFEVLAEIETGAYKCESIQDGCLPIEIFWALIGCLAGLLLIIFIVVLCWICTSRSSKPKKPKTTHNEKATMTTPTNSNVEIPASIPLHNVYINEAFIQDANGQLRLIASDGNLLDSMPHVRRGFKSNNLVQHQSINENPIYSNNQRYMSSSNGLDTIKQDMPVFFSNLSSSHSNLNSPSKQKHLTSPTPQQNSTIVASGDLERPTAKSRQHRATNSYTNPRFPPTSSNIAIISGSNKDDNNGPVYASVSRGTRKPYSYNNQQEHLKSNSYQNSNRDLVNDNGNQFSPVHSKSSTLSPRPESMPSIGRTANDSSRLFNGVSKETISTTAQPPRPVTKYQQQLPAPLPPVRLDHFPSSESETYSDLSHIIASAIKPDRTPPATLSTNQNITTPEKGQIVPEPHSLHIRTTPMPKKNGFNESGTGAVRGSTGRPKYQPPPPPRRQSQTNNINFSSNNDRTNSYNPNNINKSNINEEYYDDDSDEWDNYDEDVRFPPVGYSHA